MISDDQIGSSKNAQFMLVLNRTPRGVNY